MKVAVNGIELFFDVEGAKVRPDGPWMRDRPTVILLPTGPGIDHSLYKDNLGPALAEDVQVIYLDMRGAGRSDWSSSEHWTLETWTADLTAFCEKLELLRPVLLGTGIGGVIAVQQAARRPDLVDRLVLVSTVARYSHTRSIAEFDRLGGPEAGEVAARYFADPTELNFAEFMRVCVPLYARTPLPPDAVARIEMNLALTAHWDATSARDFDVRADAARVQCPVLMLAGEDDPSTTIAGIEELVEALPAELVRYERYADTGHGVFRDRPEAIGVVREFLARGRAGVGGSARTSGHSSSITLYQAESRRCPPRTSIDLRCTPSNCAGSAAIAPRERSLRASVFSSTRRQPSRSKACSNISSFASMLTPLPQTSGVSHVQPISRLRCSGRRAR